MEVTSRGAIQKLQYFRTVEALGANFFYQNLEQEGVKI